MVHADVFCTDPIVGRYVIILEQCNTTRCTVIQYFINTIESDDSHQVRSIAIGTR